MCTSDPLVLTDSYYGEWDIIEFGYFQCNSETIGRLIDCPSYGYPCSSQQLAGLRCVTYETECTHGEVRLTGGPEGEAAGLLEMCYNGIWTPVCSSHTHDEEASVACKQLGHTEYTCTHN